MPKQPQSKDLNKPENPAPNKGKGLKFPLSGDAAEVIAEMEKEQEKLGVTVIFPETD